MCSIQNYYNSLINLEEKCAYTCYVGIGSIPNYQKYLWLLRLKGTHALRHKRHYYFATWNSLQSAVLFSSKIEVAFETHVKCITGCTYRDANSTVNQITTKISILYNISMACFSYSSIVEKTLKAKHVNTIKNLQ